MRALERLRDLIALVNDSDTCPCQSLGGAGFDAVEGAHDATTQLLAEMAHAADILATGDVAAATEHAGHVLVIALHLGYILGAESAYDVVLSADVVVPDTLAALDILGDR